MLKKLFKKLSGVQSYKDLLNKAFEVVESYDTDNDSDICLLVRNRDQLQEWKEYFKPDLVYISEAKNLNEQRLRLREKTVEQLESSIQNSTLLSEARNADEKRAITNVLYENKDFDEAMSIAPWSYIFSEAAVASLRNISFELGNATKTDWFPMYCDLYRHFINSMYDDMIARKKDDINVLEPLIPPLKKALDETREKILLGYQWEYDREQIERERQEEAALEKAKTPPKVKFVTNHQIDELAEFLSERYRRASKGELYKIEGHSPTDLANVIFVDTGVMLIALSECVEDLSTAQTALKHILYLAFTKMGITDDLPATPAKVPIESQMEIYLIKEEHEEQGWLSGVCLVATYLMYGIDADTLTEDEKVELGRLSAKNINDAWCAYATTMNVFGYDMETKGLMSNE